MKILNYKYINTHGDKLVSISCYLSLPTFAKALSHIVVDKYIYKYFGGLMKYKYKKIQMDAILVKQILDQTNTYNFIEDE